MKRLCPVLTLIMCLLLSACGGRADIERFEGFSSELAQRDVISFCSNIRCEYPDRSVEYRLYYEGNPQSAEVKVLEPDIIAGTSISLKPDGTYLNFEELSIETGSLDAYGLNPMSALPLLSSLLKDAYVKSSWQEDDLLAFELSKDEGCRANVFFDPVNMLPVKAEIVSGDTVTVFCSIDNWLKIME